MIILSRYAQWKIIVNREQKTKNLVFVDWIATSMSWLLMWWVSVILASVINIFIRNQDDMSRYLWQKMVFLSLDFTDKNEHVFFFNVAILLKNSAVLLWNIFSCFARRYPLPKKVISDKHLLWRFLLNLSEENGSLTIFCEYIQSTIWYSGLVLVFITKILFATFTKDLRRAKPVFGHKPFYKVFCCRTPYELYSIVHRLNFRDIL